MSGSPIDLGGLQQTLTNLNLLLAALQQTLAGMFPLAGATPLHYESAATTNATSVTAVATTLRNLNVENTTAVIYYLKLYNKASTPTVGTDIPVATFALKANDRTAPSLPFGMKFSLGLAFAITAGAANADVAAAAVGLHVNLGVT